MAKVVRSGRVAQRESTRFTREGSLVRSQPRPSRNPCKSATSPRGHFAARGRMLSHARSVRDLTPLTWSQGSERRPVTPEVAGSSPVAPVREVPASQRLFIHSFARAGNKRAIWKPFWKRWLPNDEGGRLFESVRWLFVVPCESAPLVFPEGERDDIQRLPGSLRA
jgi:hypothetical protein